MGPQTIPATNGFTPIAEEKRKGTLRNYLKGFKGGSVTPVLRSRENRYPFIIVTDKDGNEHSIFMTKKLSAKFEDVENIDIRSLGNYEVFETENAQGETRLKLGLSTENKIALNDDFDWQD